MKTLLGIVIPLLLAGLAQGQQAGPRSNADGDPYQEFSQWARENLDDSVLQVLNQIDQNRVRDFFDRVQQSFEGTNVYQLASLKDVARQVLPVLQAFAETQPYAAWLGAHMDDFAAAQKYQPPVRPVSLKMQRNLWLKELDKRPWPPLAQTYVPTLKQVFAAEKIPPQLVWVAEVESDFDPRARSPKGAAGMFQLMPSTARTENLSLWPYDERYQPQKSAHAAARYLRYLHQHYHNWELALAAYNVGEARLDKLLKQHHAHSFEAVSRWLPAETQLYVPKVEATLRQREGLSLSEVRAPAERSAPRSAIKRKLTLTELAPGKSDEGIASR